MTNWKKWCPNGCGATMYRTDKRKVKSGNKYNWIYECKNCGRKNTLPELDLFWKGDISDYKKKIYGVVNEM